MILFRKDQREVREPEPDQQEGGEGQQVTGGCFQLRRGLLFPVLPECGMFLY